MAKKIISQSRLKEVLHYCPDSGAFTWIKRLSNHAIVGATANNRNDAGYIRIGIDGLSYRAHRLAFIYMTGGDAPKEVDHINHDPSDNRWCNLRMATKKINGMNQKKSKNNTSGFNGVFRRSDDKAWCAHIMVDRKFIHLGSYKDIEDAANTMEKARIKHGFHQNHGQ